MPEYTRQLNNADQTRDNQVFCRIALRALSK
jgi:hypothetical protein